jgi:branched-chain amino acid transport system substrate-binding protein
MRPSRLIVRWLLIALSLMLCAVGQVGAQIKPVTIKIGALWPLSGPSSREGQEAKAALEVAKDIINQRTDLKGIPLAESEGLPNLSGAMIELVWADSQGKPEVGRAETERLITVEKVVAMIGSYQSAVVLAATPVSERYGIPFLVADATNAEICKKGFKTVFRTTPINPAYVRDTQAMIDDFQKKSNTNYKRIAFSHDPSFQGVDYARDGKEAAERSGYSVVGDVTTQDPATDVTPDVLKLKSMQPDILILHHYSANAILLQKAFGKYKLDVKAMIAYSNSYNLSEFLSGAGKEADYLFTPGTFPPRLIGTQARIQQVNEMFKRKSGLERMSDVAARDIQALLVLAEAINRAKSTESSAIVKALSETNLRQDQIIMPWKGVKFDATGENTLATIVMQQIIKGQYEIVWPENMATAKPIWPAPKWEERN